MNTVELRIAIWLEKKRSLCAGPLQSTYQSSNHKWKWRIHQLCSRQSWSLRKSHAARAFCFCHVTKGILRCPCSSLADVCAASSYLRLQLHGVLLVRGAQLFLLIESLQLLLSLFDELQRQGFQTSRLFLQQNVSSVVSTSAETCCLHKFQSSDVIQFMSVLYASAVVLPVTDNLVPFRSLRKVAWYLYERYKYQKSDVTSLSMLTLNYKISPTSSYYALMIKQINFFQDKHVITWWLQRNTLTSIVQPM